MLSIAVNNGILTDSKHNTYIKIIWFACKYRRRQQNDCFVVLIDHPNHPESPLRTFFFMSKHYEL